MRAETLEAQAKADTGDPRAINCGQLLVSKKMQPWALCKPVSGVAMRTKEYPTYVKRTIYRVHGDTTWTCRPMPKEQSAQQVSKHKNAP